MKYTFARRILCSCLLASLLASTCLLPAAVAAENPSEARQISFPYNDAAGKTYEYLYVVGGYHSIDSGCPAWGTADGRNVRMIGDTMGHVVITYTDGSVEEIPLTFGYTMWFYSHWQETCAPFKGSATNRDLTKLLRTTLVLKGATEGSAACVFRVKLSDKPVRSVVLKDNPDKDGTPVLHGGFLTTGTPGTLSLGACSFSTTDTYFDTHTIDGQAPCPASVREALDTLAHALMTYEEDYLAAPVFVYPEDATGSRVVFSGNAFANIATGSIYHNVQSLVNRVDADGMLHTSYKGAPSWRYDGFGCWIVGADSYYDAFYSRDGGRALMTLNAYGYSSVAETSVKYANAQMLYFPAQGLTFGGYAVPGHYTVIINKPLHYSTVLVPAAGWATKYTKAAFGNEYQNLGNQETDGHGLMMLANYTTWKNLGATSAWVESNWEALCEAPAWIEWCYAHPDLSFAKDGLLYAESEAGMMQYTLYCNVPCMLGLYGYAEMAAATGHNAEAQAWTSRADQMRTAIEARLMRPRTGTWSTAHFGFFHDPVLTMLADLYGYDPTTYPEAFASWVKASRRTYTADVASVSGSDWFGASGIGYNHSMITQNALLTDHMADATKLIENLCRISYSPRLPDPYIIPEGVSYDSTTGALRRQGDLGNLVQVAEAMKCFDMVIGIDALRGDRLHILPRLPEGWSLDVTARAVQNSTALCDLHVTYPADGRQTATVTLTGDATVKEISYRFGPLPADTKYAAVAVNGENIPCEFSLTGDSAWVNVTFPVEDGRETRLMLIYGRTMEELGTFPSETEAGTETDTDTETEVVTEPESVSGTEVEAETSTGSEVTVADETTPADETTSQNEVTTPAETETSEETSAEISAETTSDADGGCASRLSGTASVTALGLLTSTTVACVKKPARKRRGRSA